ncbi:hypothetical protein EBB07_11590 [Paenibacillaceae bacterium]|nr:hypothetical protein EBB07_11590 [Paenibacillaceae bacterium]
MEREAQRITFRNMLSNLKWTLAIIFRNSPIPASLLLLLNMLEGLAPAMTIFVTQRLIDTVIQTAGSGREHLMMS